MEIGYFINFSLFINLFFLYDSSMVVSSIKCRFDRFEMTAVRKLQSLNDFFNLSKILVLITY